MYRLHTARTSAALYYGAKPSSKYQHLLRACLGVPVTFSICVVVTWHYDFGLLVTSLLERFRHYNTNRAPLSLSFDAAWLEINKGFTKVLVDWISNKLTTQSDVYFVTELQVKNTRKKPQLLSQIKENLLRPTLSSTWSWPTCIWSRSTLTSNLLLYSQRCVCHSGGFLHAWIQKRKLSSRSSGYDARAPSTLGKMRQWSWWDPEQILIMRTSLTYERGRAWVTIAKEA